MAQKKKNQTAMQERIEEKQNKKEQRKTLVKRTVAIAICALMVLGVVAIPLVYMNM